jgi:predicted HAD superfamily Cof-like phosphohydrolase
VKSEFQEMVTEFHRALDFPVRDTPTVPSDDEVRLRARLMNEEFFEVLGAMFPNVDWYEWAYSIRVSIENASVDVDLPGLAKELCDLHYVTSGTSVQIGINEGPVMAATHSENLSKAGGGKDANGKAMRGPNYRKADIAAVLREQGWTGEESR